MSYGRKTYEESEDGADEDDPPRHVQALYDEAHDEAEHRRGIDDALIEHRGTLLAHKVLRGRERRGRAEGRGRTMGAVKMSITY